MANKRDSSRQRRARTNRAQRAALEARTKGAPTRPSRVAPSTAERLKKASVGTDGASTRAGSGDAAGKGKKARRERRPRPGDTPVDVTTLEGSWFARIMQVPGGTQAMFAGVMALVATGLMAFTKLFVAPEDAGRKGAKATQTIFERYDPAVAVPLIVVPLAIAVAAVALSFHPRRRRIWLGAAVVLGAMAVLALQYYLFVSGFFAYAVFRAAKVEGPDEPILRSVLGRGRNRGTPDDAPAEAPDDV